MTAPAPATRTVRFGIFELDLQTGELRKRGIRIALQEQPFQVLALLVARPGDLVTREELRQRLWPDAVFVDFDHGLNKAVAKIRVALGDSAESPRFVETLERRGYRFIANAEPAPFGPADRTVPAQRLVHLLTPDRAIALENGAHVLGRDRSAAVWIDSSFVSRLHARITIAGGSVAIEDLGSHNGTFVNGQRIASPRPLADGDEIRIGPDRFVVRITVSGAPTLTEVAAS